MLQKPPVVVAGNKHNESPSTQSADEIRIWSMFLYAHKDHTLCNGVAQRRPNKHRPKPSLLKLKDACAHPLVSEFEIVYFN